MTDETPAAAGSGASEAEARESAPRRLHLRAWHARQSAVWGIRRGAERPLHYGDPGSELERLRRGCALVDISDSGRLELLGPDRARFLNGLVTVDVGGLDEGSTAHGFVTENKGRIVSEATIAALPDRLWMLLPPGRSRAVAEHLLHYRVADRVEVLAMEDLLPFVLVGGGLASALEAAGLEAPEDLAGDGSSRLCQRKVTWLGSELHVGWSDRFGAPALNVWVSASIAGEVVGELLEQLGAGLAGDDACEVLRLEAGIPRFGVDYGETNLPGEVGTVGTVDWKKGCYLGQEIVARMHYRGQPARVLRRLRLGGERLPEPGARVVHEDRPAGAITSVARSPELGGLALALVQRRAGDPGTVVEIEGLGAARVEALPSSE